MSAIYFNSFDNSYIPHILKEIYIDKIYEPFFQGKKDLTVLDVGANIGLFSMYAAKYARSLYSVEPSKLHLDSLKKNLRGLNSSVIVPKALSNSNGTATFYHSDNETMFSLKQEVNTRPKDAEKVETITIDKLFDDYRLEYVDFLKLDVEGSESDVVCGTGFETVADKIGAMVVEWHSWSNTNPSLLVNTLTDYGFKVTQIPNEATLFYATK